MRDELEQLLDDDMDMAEMYLTCKLDQQELADREDRDGNDQSETNSYYEWFCFAPHNFISWFPIYIYRILIFLFLRNNSYLSFNLL